jgi:2-oxoglutarate dehydrogenase complex dehydrogenase (E1) component-like enzyme
MTRQEKNDTFLLTSFLYGGNADYIEQLYSRFKTDPSSVDATWSSFFSRLDDSQAEPRKMPKARAGAARTGRRRKAASWSMRWTAIGAKSP